MASQRTSSQRDDSSAAFARILKREEEALEQSKAKPSSSPPADCDSAPAADDPIDPISDLYRQHSHQQSMEGG
ncbi:hypothetical protein [Synechococcus sp. UW140]|uniref:hypothetical protein n=1 Tax=Synechococcus sp. UW140 TaxID=368503 RepID=UPI000E0F4CA3|nr:hypothetical protein [Synechococcus sp. UW140]